MTSSHREPPDASESPAPDQRADQPGAPESDVTSLDGQALDGPALDQLADRLHSAAIHLLRRLRTIDTATGLSAPRLSALSVIVFGGPLTLGALAAAEQVRPPTMTRLVTGLEQAGLVTREPDPTDGRQVLIRATPAGRQLLDDGRSRRTASLARRLAGLSPDELAELAGAAALLERLARSPD